VFRTPRSVQSFNNLTYLLDRPVYIQNIGRNAEVNELEDPMSKLEMPHKTTLNDKGEKVLE